MSWVTDSAFLRAKQTVTVTIEFCSWLAAEHYTAFENVTQAHIDLWQSTGPTAREHILRFIRWGHPQQIGRLDTASAIQLGYPHSMKTDPGAVHAVMGGKADLLDTPSVAPR